MPTLYFQGNTYIFGATAPKNIGTGTVNYTFTGLKPNTNYKFIIVAKNALGFSGIAGPINVTPSSNIYSKERDDFVAFAWTWPSAFGEYQWDYQWSEFGSATGPESGNTGNYFVSSENLGNTNWHSLFFQRVVPSWMTINGNINDPFGGTGAYLIEVSGLTNSQTISYGQNIGGVPAGLTYIMSMYINVDGTTTNWYVNTGWKAGFGGYTGIPMRQILPIGASSSTATLNPLVKFVSGETGWQRFAWEFYARPVTSITTIGVNSTVSGITWEIIGSEILNRTFVSGVTANIYLYGPQLEPII